MARFNPKLAYIDGFAGPGKYEGGEDGSPLVVLKTAVQYLNTGALKPGQLTLILIEKDARRHAALLAETEALRKSDSTYNGLNTIVVQSEYAETMAQLWKVLADTGASLAPTLAFVDPFGVSGIPYVHVKRLLSFPKTEVLVNVMYEEINRFLNEPEFEKHLTDLFGDDSWHALTTLSGVERKVALVEIFRKRLLEAKAKYVQVFEMRNEQNRTDYFLFFATKGIKGLEVMKEAMWYLDRSGSFSFSDYTYSRGPMLISPSPDFALLQRQLQKRFGGTEVKIDAVHEFVLAETSFYHYKTEALKAMERAGHIRCQAPPGKRHRLGGYPPGTKIQFETSKS